MGRILSRMYFPPAPATVRAPSQGRRGWTPIILGGTCLTLSIALMIVSIALAQIGQDDQARGLQRVTLDARSGTVTFARAGNYIAYYEVPEDGTDALPPIGLVLTGPSGQRQVVNDPYGGDGLSYDTGSRYGETMYRFTVAAPGAERVTLTPTGHEPRGAAVAFGPDGSHFMGAIYATLFASLGLGVAALLLGIGIRFGSRRAVPSGYPGGWPPAGGW